MKRSRRQVEKDGAKRLDGSWPRPDYTTCVGTSVHQDRKTPCSHLYWAGRFSKILTTGNIQNDLYDICCIGIRSEKAIVQSIRQKCVSKYISEQTGNSVVSVLHSPSRVEQNTTFSFPMRPFPAAKDHWLMVCIRRQDIDFISTTHSELCITIQCIEKKEFLLPPFDGQWTIHSIPNYQNKLSETAAFSLHNKNFWINNLSLTSVLFIKTS